VGKGKKKNDRRKKREEKEIGLEDLERNPLQEQERRGTQRKGGNRRKKKKKIEPARFHGGGWVAGRREQNVPSDKNGRGEGRQGEVVKGE